jgi:hypothetical protein
MLFCNTAKCKGVRPLLSFKFKLLLLTKSCTRAMLFCNTAKCKGVKPLNLSPLYY